MPSKPNLSKVSASSHPAFGTIRSLFESFEGSRASCERFAADLRAADLADPGLRRFLLEAIDESAKLWLKGPTPGSRHGFVFGDEALRALLRHGLAPDESHRLTQHCLNADMIQEDILPFLELPDVELGGVMDAMLRSEDVHARTAALDLLGRFLRSGRLERWIAGRVAEYRRDHPLQTSLEETFIAQLMEKTRHLRAATAASPGDAGRSGPANGGIDGPGRPSNWPQRKRWVPDAEELAEPKFPKPPEVIREYERGEAVDGDLAHFLLFSPRYPIETRAWALREMPPTLRENYIRVARAVADEIVDEELARQGDEPARFTKQIKRIKRIEGLGRLSQFLEKLGGRGFTPMLGYSDKRRGSVEAVLTQLIRLTVPPTPAEPQPVTRDPASGRLVSLDERLREEFRTVVGPFLADDRLSPGRLVELAFVAPQWALLIEDSLGRDGLAEAAYWLHLSLDSDAAVRLAECDGYLALAESEIDRLINAEGADPVDREIALQMHAKRLLATAASGEDIVGQGRIGEPGRDEHPILDIGASRRWRDRLRARFPAGEWEALHAAMTLGEFADRVEAFFEKLDMDPAGAKFRKILGRVATKYGRDEMDLVAQIPLAPGGSRLPDLAHRVLALLGARESIRRKIVAEGSGRGEDLEDLLLDGESTEAALQSLAGLADCSSTRQLLWEVDDAEALRGIPDATIARLDRAIRHDLERAMILGERFPVGDILACREKPLLTKVFRSLILLADPPRGGPGVIAGVLRDDAPAKLVDARSHAHSIAQDHPVRIAHPVDLHASAELEAWSDKRAEAKEPEDFEQVSRPIFLAGEEPGFVGLALRSKGFNQLNKHLATAGWWDRGGDCWEKDFGLLRCRASYRRVGSGAELAPATFHDIDADSEADGAPDAPPISPEKVPPRIFSEAIREIDQAVRKIPGKS